MTMGMLEDGSKEWTGGETGRKLTQTGGLARGHAP